jgi:D-arabinose 1-dehydrogenase-like Zn-dependent alcohol dehydrogenase
MGQPISVRQALSSEASSGPKDRARLGADAVFATNEELPRRVDAVVDNVGKVTWAHSLRSLRRGGTLVVNGITTGGTAETDLLRIFVEQIDIRGTIMGTLEEMNAMISFIVTTGIQPEIGATIPMAKAREAIGSMIAGNTRGKTVFTR